jgi:hypothetical protein
MPPHPRSILFYENEDVELVGSFEKKGTSTLPTDGFTDGFE